MRDERGELFDLEAQGASPATLRAHLRLRALLVAAFGVVGGIALGAILASLVIALVSVTAAATGPSRPSGSSSTGAARCSLPRSTCSPRRCSSARRRRCAAGAGRAAEVGVRRDRAEGRFRVYSTPEGDAAALQGLSLRVAEGEV